MPIAAGCTPAMVSDSDARLRCRGTCTAPISEARAQPEENKSMARLDGKMALVTGGCRNIGAVPTVDGNPGA